MARVRRVTRRPERKQKRSIDHIASCEGQRNIGTIGSET